MQDRLQVIDTKDGLHHADQQHLFMFAQCENGLGHTSKLFKDLFVTVV